MNFTACTELFRISANHWLTATKLHPNTHGYQHLPRQSQELCIPNEYPDVTDPNAPEQTTPRNTWKDVFTVWSLFTLNLRVKKERGICKANLRNQQDTKVQKPMV